MSTAPEDDEPTPERMAGDEASEDEATSPAGGAIRAEAFTAEEAQAHVEWSEGADFD
ncbi:MAG TPA: hypothetical protein VGC18_01875 [Lacisediminihabitans sp.]|uniref:hypothetical protein n=1 Tax=Lacisediminihabitans sp. TaxID=2787631 RepID=UPI002EDB8DD6